MLLRKFKFILCFTIFLLSFNVVSEVNAEPTNVLDWIEDEETEKSNDQDNIPENELETDDTEPISDGGSNSLAFSFVKMIFALLLVLALIYVIVKLLGRKNKLFNQINALENLGGINLAPNKSIQIVRIGTKFYLIGVGEDVQLLQEITEAELINQLLDNDKNTESKETLISMLMPKTEGKTKKSNTNFKNLFSDELDKLKENRKKMVNKQKDDEA